MKGWDMQKSRVIVPCLILTHALSSDAETQTGAFDYNSNSESDADVCRFRQLWVVVNKM